MNIERALRHVALNRRPVSTGDDVRTGVVSGIVAGLAFAAAVIAAVL